MHLSRASLPKLQELRTASPWVLVRNSWGTYGGASVPDTLHPWRLYRVDLLQLCAQVTHGAPQDPWHHQDGAAQRVPDLTADSW